MGASRWVFFAAGASAVLVAWSCEDAEPVPDPAPLHQGFPILGAHAIVECADCHIDGAREQGLPPERDTGWVTALRTGCLDCHTDTAQAFFPQGHKDGRSCGEAGCHSASDFCWGQVWRACDGTPVDPGDTDPPEPIVLDHEGQTALNFPLEGPHAVAGDVGCGTCHLTAPDYSPEVGGGSDCTKCHIRAENGGPGPDHYPPRRTGGEEKERGCKACHATNDATGKLLIGPDWATGAVNHEVLWPHALVEEWDAAPPVLRAEADWVSACSDCHTTPGQYGGAWSCAACHDATNLSPNGYHSDGTPCIQCHAEAD